MYGRCESSVAVYVRPVWTPCGCLFMYGQCGSSVSVCLCTTGVGALCLSVYVRPVWTLCGCLCTAGVTVDALCLSMYGRCLRSVAVYVRPLRTICVQVSGCPAPLAVCRCVYVFFLCNVSPCDDRLRPCVQVSGAQFLSGAQLVRPQNLIGSNVVQGVSTQAISLSPGELRPPLGAEGSGTVRAERGGPGDRQLVSLVLILWSCG